MSNNLKLPTFFESSACNEDKIPPPMSEIAKCRRMQELRTFFPESDSAVIERLYCLVDEVESRNNERMTIS